MTPTAPIRSTWVAGMRNRLESMCDELRAIGESASRELAIPPEDRGEDTTPSQHPADVAGDLERRELLLARHRTDSRDLGGIEAALARIAAGTYGVCVDCGREIPRGRLEARPQAERDLDCERRFRQGR